MCFVVDSYCERWKAASWTGMTARCACNSWARLAPRAHPPRPALPVLQGMCLATLLRIPRQHRDLSYALLMYAAVAAADLVWCRLHKGSWCRWRVVTLLVSQGSARGVCKAVEVVGWRGWLSIASAAGTSLLCVCVFCAHSVAHLQALSSLACLPLSCFPLQGLCCV
mgnify:CR=1 FL=1